MRGDDYGHNDHLLFVWREAVGDGGGGEREELFRAAA
jgi:transposase-like protein